MLNKLYLRIFKLVTKVSIFLFFYLNIIGDISKCQNPTNYVEGRALTLESPSPTPPNSILSDISKENSR